METQARGQKDGQRDLKEAVAKSVEWERKFESLKSEVALKLQLKEAEVKNSMMAVAWSAHTSALTMRFGAGGLAGGAMGSGSPAPGAAGSPPFSIPSNPFSSLGLPNAFS